MTQGEGALAGTYDLSVLNLARAETSRSFAFADDAAGAFGASGTLGITVGADTEVTVDYDATMSLSDLAFAINASDARVSASVLFDGAEYRLQVSAEGTGTANALSFTDSGGATGLTDAAAEVVAAEDAQFVINGTTVTRSSNVVDDAIVGVTFELLAENVTDAQIKVSDDVEALRESMQGYVDAFNNVASQIERQLSLTGDRASEGSLFGDSTLKMLQRQLASLTAGSYGDDGARLADFGIEIDQQGSLTLDAAKFDGAVAGSPDGLIELLEGTGGLSEAITNLADVYTDSVDGLLTAKEDSIQSLLDRLDSQIDDINDDADRLQARLTAEFCRLGAADVGPQRAAGATGVAAGLRPQTKGSTRSCTLEPPAHTRRSRSNPPLPIASSTSCSRACGWTSNLRVLRSKAGTSPRAAKRSRRRCTSSVHSRRDWTARLRPRCAQIFARCIASWASKSSSRTPNRPRSR